MTRDKASEFQLLVIKWATCQMSIWRIAIINDAIDMASMQWPRNMASLQRLQSYESFVNPRRQQIVWKCHLFLPLMKYQFILYVTFSELNTNKYI